MDTSLLHLPPGDAGWSAVIAQFTLRVAAAEGRAYAAWAAERLVRTSQRCDGIVAMNDGALRGALVYEYLDHTAELSLPWTAEADPELALRLTEAALTIVRDTYPRLDGIRAERQLLPGKADTAGLESAGFVCHWRHRMALELVGWGGAAAPATGYTLVPWHIRFLDAAAEVIYTANVGSLDALLYAPFFGKSPAQCRKGLLSILAGQYGPIHAHATLCALHQSALVGVNLVLNEGNGIASIVEISVDPAHQGRGIARWMLTDSIRRLHAERFERVELAVTQANARAVRLYDSLGFLVVSNFPVCVYPSTPS